MFRLRPKKTEPFSYLCDSFTKATVQVASLFPIVIRSLPCALPEYPCEVGDIVKTDIHGNGTYGNICCSQEIDCTRACGLGWWTA